MDAETRLIGRVERVSRRYVTVTFENAFEFMAHQVSYTREKAAERLMKRRPGQRAFPSASQSIIKA